MDIIQILKNLHKNIYILAAIFIITLFLGLTPWIYSDGVGDYAWVRSVILDTSLDCTDEFEYYVATFQDKYGWEGTTDDLYPVKTSTGYQANKYPIGTALLWSPFFIMGHIFTYFVNLFGADLPLDGYSKYYVLFVCFGSALYAFLGLLFSYLTAAYFFNRSVALLATVSIWFASSLPVYMYLYPAMPHASSLFIISLLIYYWIRIRKNETIKTGQMILLGVLSGFAVFVRFENAMLLSFPFFDFLLRMKNLWKNGQKPAFNKCAYQLLIYFVFMFLAFSPQIVVWKIIFGKFILEPYEEMSMLVHAAKGLSGPHFPGVDFTLTSDSFTLAPIVHLFSHPYLGDTFFSTSHGLYIWTPIFVFASLGFIFFFYKHKKVGFFLFAAVFLFVYFISCANQATGMSYGNRYLIPIALFFILGLAAFFNYAIKKVSLKYLYIIVSLFILWNGMLIIQYSTGLLNRQGSINWSPVIKNQFTKAPKKLVEMVIPFIIGRSDVYKGNKTK